MSLGSQMHLNDRDSNSMFAGALVNGVMNPNWPGRLMWDLAVIVVVLVDAMILPFQMAFQDGGSFFFDIFWLWLTTGFFASDMCLSMLTAYTAGKNEQDVPPGRLVTSRRRIVRNYMKTWFLVDFPSTMPWGKFADLLSGGGDGEARSAQMAKLTKIVKFLRFLRLMRMLRLAKLATIWERVEAKMGNLLLKQSVALFRVLFALTAICHWNACIWWMIGQPSSLFTDMLSVEAAEDFAKQRHWTTEVRFVGERAVKDEPGWTWLQKDLSDQYIFCFYWTLGVMRTMPSEVQPTNNVERLYVMVFMFFAFSAFAICVALITQTFFKFSERRRFFEDDAAAVRSYMRYVGASKNVQSSVKSFLRHLFDRRKIEAKEVGLLSNLPNSLGNMLKSARLDRYLLEIPVLGSLPKRALVYVSDMAELKDLAPGTCLCRTGFSVEAAYVVMSGRLAYNENILGFSGFAPKQRLFDGRIVDGECLDQAGPMISSKTLVSAVCSEVIRIDRAAFFRLMAKHEDFREAFDSNILIDMIEGCLDDEPGYKANDRDHAKDREQENQMAGIAAICAS